MIKGKTDRAVVITLSGEDIEGFMNMVIEKASKRADLTDIITGISIVEEHPKCVLLEIEPVIWKVIVPMMRKYKDDYKMGWKYEN